MQEQVSGLKISRSESISANLRPPVRSFSKFSQRRLRSEGQVSTNHMLASQNGELEIYGKP